MYIFCGNNNSNKRILTTPTGEEITQDRYSVWALSARSNSTYGTGQLNVSVVQRNRTDSLYYKAQTDRLDDGRRSFRHHVRSASHANDRPMPDLPTTDKRWEQISVQRRSRSRCQPAQNPLDSIHWRRVGRHNRLVGLGPKAVTVLQQSRTAPQLGHRSTVSGTPLSRPAPQ